MFVCFFFLFSFFLGIKKNQVSLVLSRSLHFGKRKIDSTTTTRNTFVPENWRERERKKETKKVP
jgi:hypothetical protein